MTDRHKLIKRGIPGKSGFVTADLTGEEVLYWDATNQRWDTSALELFSDGKMIIPNNVSIQARKVDDTVQSMLRINSSDIMKLGSNGVPIIVNGTEVYLDRAGTRFVETTSTHVQFNKPLDVNGPTITSGSGTPESAVTAPVGSLFLRTDGGAGTSFYVKESGTGNTGWVAK